MSAPPLSVADTVTVLRRRYPDALVCIECGLLLATRRESYAKSHMTEPDRLSYVCFECRQDREEAERVQEVRVERARHAAQASAEARRLRAARAGDVAGDVDINPLPVLVPDPGAEPPRIPAVYAGIPGGFISTRRPRAIPPVASTPRRGGRPRKHSTARAARTAAQRAWRARRRQQPTLSEALAHA
jgi:hypothetical protein